MGTRICEYPQVKHVDLGKHGSMAFATVHLNRDGNTTTFRVHGGGLIVGRIVNEFGTARTVTEALKDSLGTIPPADARPR